MESNLKISIVTITYNSAKTLEDTFTSVFKQTYPSLEYIVIDGGSTDNTVDIIRTHQSKLSYWISEPDRGISDAFNKGISQATGDVVGIINSDDWYADGALDAISEAFLNNPDAAFVFGDMAIVGNNKSILYKQKGDPYYFRTIRFDMPSIPHPAVFVRRSIYERYGGFDLEYKTAMDYELLLRLHVHGAKGVYIPVVIANMRPGGESDAQFRRGYYEVYKCSVRYGYNPFYGRIRYNYKCFKTLIKKTIEKIGFDVLIRWFRIYTGRRYKYD